MMNNFFGVLQPSIVEVKELAKGSSYEEFYVRGIEGRPSEAETRQLEF